MGYGLPSKGQDEGSKELYVEVKAEILARYFQRMVLHVGFSISIDLPKGGYIFD